MRVSSTLSLFDTTSVKRIGDVFVHCTEYFLREYTTYSDATRNRVKFTLERTTIHGRYVAVKRGQKYNRVWYNSSSLTDNKPVYLKRVN